MACETKSAIYGFIAVLAITLFSAALIGFESEADAEENPQLIIIIDTVYATSGDSSIEVPIIIEDNSGFFGGEFQIGYDSNLTLTGISAGVMPLTPNDNYSMNPYPFYLENSSIDDIDQKGLLVTLYFDAPSGKSGEFPIILDFSEVFNVAGKDVEVICEDGAIVTSTVRVPVTGVSVIPSTVSIKASQTATLTASVSPSNATNKNVSWRSSNPDVATISSTGVVTGMSSGTASIFVTTQDGSFSSVCRVTVDAGIKATSITLNADSLSLETGDTFTLKATVLPQNTTDKRVTWTSSQGDIVSVDSNGKVTAKSAGSAYIIATSVGGDVIPAICLVEVKEKVVSVTGVSLDKTSLSLKVKEKTNLNAVVNPSNATNKNLTWKSSNTSVATVSDGTVTAVSTGTATITVTTSDGGYKATCKVIVTRNASSNCVSISVDAVQSEPGAKNVEVNITVDSNGGFFGSDFEIEYGQGLTLKELKSGTLMAITPNEDYTINPYFFYAENSAVSDVTSTGVLATLVFDVVGDASGSLPVKIVRTEMFNVAGELISPNLVEGAVVIGSSDIRVTGVDIKPDTLSLDVGKTANLTVNISPSDATNKNVSWRSSDAGVATVSSTGVVTAIKEGKANIFVTTEDGSFSDISLVTVTNPNVPVSGVSLDSARLSLETGEKHTLKATVSPSDATDKSVTWKSSKTTVAKVSTSGVVTAVAPGTATVTVTTTDGSKTATCVVTVVAPMVNVTGVSLDSSKLSLEAGEKHTLTATVSPSDATDKSVTWKSSKTAVAKVSSAGVVTAVAPGTATITVTTNDGSKTATCVVTVVAPMVNVTGVTLNASSISIEKGSTAILTATVLPSDATDKSVTWKSSKTAVAKVSASGVVTAVAVGTATITVTTVDGAKTATCTVKVVKASDITEGEVFSFDGIEYTVLQDMKSVSVTGCSSDKTEVSLPASVTYKGKALAVESIGEKAFFGSPIVSVNTGSVPTIGMKAFASCPSLSDVTIGAKSIMGYAFYGSMAITHIKFSDALTDLGTQALGSLKFLDFSGNELKKNAANLAGKEFTGSDSVLMAVPAIGETFSVGGLNYTVISDGSVSLTGSEEKITELTVPSEVSVGLYKFSVDSIGEKAFFGSSLVSVDTGSVPTIGMKAFASSPSLSDVTIGAKSIMGYAFYGSMAITHIKFSDALTDLGTQALGSLKFMVDGAEVRKTAGNLAGKEFYVIDGVLQCVDIAVGETFYVDGLKYTITSAVPLEVSLSGYQGNPTVVIAPDHVEYKGLEFKVTYIADKAFYKCNSIVFADISAIPASGTRVFEYCSCLVSAVVDMEVLRGYYFLDCPSLRYVDISGSKEIRAYAFHNTSGIYSITFSDELSKVYSNAFNAVTFYGADGSALKVTASDLKGKTFVGSDSKLYERLSVGSSFVMDGIQYSIDSESSVTITGYEGSISSLIVPVCVSYGGSAYTVDSVSAKAFYGCTTLEYADLGAVSMIGDRAFANCTSLVGVKVSAPYLGTYCFFGCPLKNLDLTSVVTIDASAFSECSALESLVFSDSLAYVGKNAFFRAFFYSTDGAAITEDAAGLAGKTFMGADSKLYECPKVGAKITVDGLVYSVTSIMPNEVSLVGYEGSISAISVLSEVKYGSLSFKVRAIADQAFYKCETLIYAYLGDVETVGFKAFAGCTGLVYVNTSAKSIGSYAFFGCTKLYGMDLSSALTIGASAFSGVPLAFATFSWDLFDVGKNAFYGLTFMDGVSKLDPTASNLAGKSFAGDGKVLSRVA